MKYQRRKEGTAEDWVDLSPGAFPVLMLPGHEYRIKPEPAAPKWPQTTMTYQQLKAAYLYVPSVICWDEMAAMSLANAVIAHACQYGELVPAEKVRVIEAKARAEGVKEGIQQGYDRIQFCSSHGGQMIGYQLCQTFSESQMEIQRNQQADAMARGLRK